MNPETILNLASELRCLKFFPAEAGVLNAIVRLLGNMCETEDQVRWLIHRMTGGIYAEWPGVAEMRACYCSKYKPKDGITVYSSVYLEFPLSMADYREQKFKALPKGSKISVIPVFDQAIIDLANLKDINNIGIKVELRDAPGLKPGEKLLTQDAANTAIREMQEGIAKKLVKRGQIAERDVELL
jgi:hypothetical protein